MPSLDIERAVSLTSSDAVTKLQNYLINLIIVGKSGRFHVFVDVIENRVALQERRGFADAGQ